MCQQLEEVCLGLIDLIEFIGLYHIQIHECNFIPFLIFDKGWFSPPVAAFPRFIEYCSYSRLRQKTCIIGVEWFFKEITTALEDKMIDLNRLNLQYVVDENGNKRAVIFPIESFQELIEDIEDLVIVAERHDEATISHQDLLESLKD